MGGIKVEVRVEKSKLVCGIKLKSNQVLIDTVLHLDSLLLEPNGTESIKLHNEPSKMMAP